MRTRSVFALGLTGALALAGCSNGSPAHSAAAPSPSTSFPVTVHTSQGDVTIRARPTAIVSLSPTATEMAYAIGAGGQVKAVDKNSDYPTGVPRTQLSEFNLNIESVAALKPDLVLLDGTQPSVAQRLAALHLPVLSLPAATQLTDVYTELDQLGRATGHPAEAAAESRSIAGQVHQIVASVPHRAKPLTYYWELEQDFYSVTSDTFIGHLLSQLGLRSIADAAPTAAKSGGYPQLSAEYVLRAKPDYIFLADTRCCQQSVATVQKRPGWAALPAVKSGQVVPLNDDIASRWGPRLIDLLRQVAQALSGRSG